MGAAYIGVDREDITFAPSCTPYNKLRLNGSIGVRRNNLKNDKLATTRRLISSFGANWQAMDDLGLDFRYSNYSTSSSDGRVRVTDTSRVENVSQSFGGGPRWSFVTGETRHTMSLGLTHQLYDDRNLLTGALNANSSTSGTLNYGSSIDDYGVNGGLSLSEAESSSYANTTFNASAGVSKSFMDGRFSLSGSLTWSVVNGGGNSEAQLLPSITASYLLTDRDVFSFSFQLTRNTRTDSPFTEVVTNAGYSRTF
jgi:hypothetical protein